MNNAQAILDKIRDGNEAIEQHYDERVNKTAAFISSGLPFTIKRVALLLRAMKEWVTATATDKKIRGEDSLLLCLQDAVAFLDEIYEPSGEELDLEAKEAADNLRITQDKEERS